MSHDAEVAAAAAQSPEEIRVVVGARANLFAIGGDDLRRAQIIAREAKSATQPTEAAAKR
jgi:hypothetical protein